MGQTLPFRARDATNTKQMILDAARAEFAKAGLGGARVDSIAAISGVNKRMIYYYFGNKDQLFTAVVEDAYLAIRNKENQLGLEKLRPSQAIEKLVKFTWEYYLENPDFLALVNSENLHQARHLSGNKEIRKFQKAYVDMIDKILRHGVEIGEFRAGVDAIQLSITIAAVGFYYLTNRHTGRVIFGFNFTSRDALAARIEFNIDTIMRIVLAKPD